MSRAKTTKAAKRRSAINLYRHIGELLNHANKVVVDGNKKPATPTTNDKAESK